MSDSERFLVGGYESLRRENEPEVRSEIESKYADQIKTASWFQRRRLRKQIENEINIRLDELAPPDALY